MQGRVFALGYEALWKLFFGEGKLDCDGLLNLGSSLS